MKARILPSVRRSVATWKVCPNNSSIPVELHYLLSYLGLKKISKLQPWPQLAVVRCWAACPLSALLPLQRFGSTPLTTLQCCGFWLHPALPPARVLTQFGYRGEASTKRSLALPRVGWKQGSSACQGSGLLWMKLGLHLFELLGLLVSSAQPLGPSARSLEFGWFISRPSRVWGSVLLRAPAYHGSDMASLSKCLALLDSGWVLYRLLTLNKHLVFITNGSRAERGAVLGGAVT